MHGLVSGLCRALLVALTLTLWAGPAPAEKLSQEKQETLALEIFQKLAKTPQEDYEAFNRLYHEVIQQCPDTERAEMAYWRLSNLFILAYSPPRRKEAAQLLEQFLDRYPQSKGVPTVKQRLVALYEETGQPCKAADLYAEVVPRIPKPPDSQGLAYWALYADALKGCGKTAEACTWYRKVLAATKDKESMSAMIAQDGATETCK